ncbi:hypothetical protein DXG01_005567 [Tephrocybe rancida]|nr:hypothetical protein DXG01_005567 [Tephrocybe rancida]
MAGAFSGHLIDSFHAQQARQSGPFGTQNPHIITSGAMSFNSQMHGTPAVGNHSMGDYSFSFGSAQPSFFNPELSEATTLKIAALQAKLNQRLGPEYISQRPGPGGGPKLTYAEGWKIINLANEVFGFNGWSSNVVSLTTDFIDYNEESRRYTVGTTAIIRVTLRDGVFHEDIGYGMLENSKSKGAALDKCKKEAVTDGLKRALRNFGNLLGNCLYDKTYTQEVVKIKVPQPKFDKSELHRRPEFEGTKPNITSTSNIASTSTSTASSRMSDISMNLPAATVEDVKPKITTSTTLAPSSRLAHISTNLPSNNTAPPCPAGRPPQQQSKVLSSIPSHVHSEINATAGPSHTARNEQSNSSSTAQIASNSLSASTAGRPNVSTCNPSIPAPVRHPTAANSHENAKPPISVPGPGASTTSRAPAPPQNRNTAVEDGDESYHFGSDDDAFLALVDLGEGDLGQPLLPETDLGRPLFDDEQELDGGHSFVGEEAQAQSSFPRDRQGGGQQAAPSAGMLTRLLPQNQPQQQQNPQRAANQFSSGSNHRLQKQQQQQPSSNNQFNPATKPASRSANEAPRTNQNAPHRSHQNQNQPPAGVTSTPNRPSTPSMGGFHFPPGVDLRAPFGPEHSSGIGTKRPLESISSSTAARPGVGQVARVPGQGQPKREVFGRLDVAEGGDVKRARR